MRYKFDCQKEEINQNDDIRRGDIWNLLATIFHIQNGQNILGSF
jgi:hypothetical protein